MQQNDLLKAKVEATWDYDDPIFTPRERAALEMASIFTERYHDFADEDIQRWQAYFTQAELVELAAFMAVCDGFGKAVEMLGLGDVQEDCD